MIVLFIAALHFEAELFIFHQRGLEPHLKTNTESRSKTRSWPKFNLKKSHPSHKLKTNTQYQRDADAELDPNNNQKIL